LNGVLAKAGLAAVVAASAAATATIGLWPFGADRAETGGRGSPLRVFASLPAREAFFGDEVEAHLEMIVDERLLSAGDVRVDTRFHPYKVASRASRTDDLGKGFRRITTVYRLRCLDEACVPPGASYRIFRFGSVRVAAGGSSRKASWPPLVVVSRVYKGSNLRTDGVRAGPAREGSSSSAATALLWGSVAFGAAATATLAAWALRRRRLSARHATTTPGPVTGPSPDPIATACDRVRERFGEQAWGRRRGALEGLACALAAGGAHELAATARTLAWDRTPPDESAVQDLLHRIEQSNDGGWSAPQPSRA
jgi:hypothetical protein